MNHSHYKKVCRDCKKIMMQCKCWGAKVKTFGRCLDCIGKDIKPGTVTYYSGGNMSDKNELPREQRLRLKALETCREETKDALKCAHKSKKILARFIAISANEKLKKASEKIDQSINLALEGFKEHEAFVKEINYAKEGKKELKNL